MLQISSHVTIPDSEIDIHAMRSQGAGGQNVNKVSSAIHLQFDIAASSLPPFYKEELAEIERSSHLTRGRDHHQSPAVSEPGAESRGCAHSTERAYSECGHPTQETQSHEADEGFEATAVGEQDETRETENPQTNARVG